MPRSGTLIIVGGHEDKEGDRLILKDLTRRVGDGKLVVVTVASEEPEAMWDQYERVFRRLGVRHLYRLQVESREDAMSERKRRVLDEATGVFFTGGDQIRITMLLGKTPVCERLHEIYESGGVIAGTSAGASVMSTTMVASGSESGSARVGQTLHMAPGLGFVQDMLIDQHFSERGRVPRMLGALANNPKTLGVGIDENTAIVVENWGQQFHVVGEGAVYVMNAAPMRYANLSDAETNRALSMFGIQLDVLSQGDSYDVESRTPSNAPARAVEQEIGRALVGAYRWVSGAPGG